MERRLAAVLIADVAGYSRLSQADEEGTRAAFLADLQNIFAPKIADHRGRLVKTMGDGLLVEFASVVDAVRCAIDVQRAKADQTPQAGPRLPQLAFRIGVNLGDVIVEGSDIHGDGVNIADRVQGLAEPGGIALSGTAYDQVQNRIEVGFVDLGEQRVKNIDRPLRAYRVSIEPAAAGRTIRRRRLSKWRRPHVAAAVGALVVAVGAAGLWLLPRGPNDNRASVERMALPLPGKPSLVVLPFENLSDDPKQDYFADGLTDDLITELSQVSGLFVIASHSAFAYKGKPVKIAQVAEELGVRYVLDGSVQRSGDQVRINARFIDALSGGQIWAERFDGSLADIFVLQDTVARASANALALQLAARQGSSAAPDETSAPAAYDAFLRGWEHYRRTTPEDYAAAIPYFEAALALDPGYTRARAALAMVHVRAFSRHWGRRLGIPDNEALARAQRYLSQSRKQPNALAEQANGYLLLHRGRFDRALEHFQEAIALDPGDSWSYAFAAFALTMAGRPAEALPFIEVATRLDPHSPPLFDYYRGLIELGLAEFEAAAASLASAAALSPGDQFIFPPLAAAYAHLGRHDQATAAVSRYNDIEVAQGGLPLTLSNCGDLHCGIENRQITTGLRLIGVPGNLCESDFAARNRLSADEGLSLILGHRWHGRSRTTGVERTAMSTGDGIAEMSGDWVTGIRPLSGGTVSGRGDDLCLSFAAREYCGRVLRNPGGTRRHENELIWCLSEPFQFSLAE